MNSHKKMVSRDETWIPRKMIKRDETEFVMRIPHQMVIREERMNPVCESQAKLY